MSEEVEVLAQRAVACPAWRWMPGMLATDGQRFTSKPAPKMLSDGTLADAAWMADSDCNLRLVLVAGLVPDLADPATLGCLLALVREAWGESFAGVGVVWFGGHGEWCVVDGDARLMAHTARVLARGRSEAAALVAALEAAPAKVAP